MNSLAIIWPQYGPYHMARAAALRKWAGPAKVHALELANRSSDYSWNRPAATEVITLFRGAVAEELPFWKVYARTRRVLSELGVEVCLLPSYFPAPSLAALLAAKSLGIGTVMMNESHAGTARARGAAAWVKGRLVRWFDAALVGGAPQKEYFVSLGMREDRIFTGYDAVDNDYFAQRAEDARSRSAEMRAKHGLPEHYFLSLGRFVAKKNLGTLIGAYRKFLDSSKDGATHLVMVGAGVEEAKLHSLCAELRLPIYNKANDGAENGPPGVHFYGFRQVEENAVFYALADAFVLPSAREEWGLVANEAMACGLPVVVSETAGCARDLMIRDGADGLCRNGFVFDPDSADTLADALLTLAWHPETRAAMGRASRAIIEHFSCDVFARNALMAARAATGEPAPPASAAQPPSGQPALLTS